MIVVGYTAPSAWASYLINGDASGLSDADVAEADAFIRAVGLGQPVSCEDEGFIWHSDARDLGCIEVGADCQSYVFYGDLR